MGAVIAAGPAMGWSDDDLEARIRAAFVNSDPLSDLAVPIIAMTANVQPEQVARCREAGMDPHVGKPIAVAELVAAMVGCLERSREPAGLAVGAA